MELSQRARESLGGELRNPVDLDSHAVTHQIFAHDSPRFAAIRRDSLRRKSHAANSTHHRRGEESAGQPVLLTGGARWNRTIGLSIIRETVTRFMTSHSARIYLLSRSFVILRSASVSLIRHHSCRPSRRKGAASPLSLSLSHPENPAVIYNDLARLEWRSMPSQ